MIGWSKRGRKQESREFVLDGYVQKAAAIFMPGWDEAAQQAGQDIRTGLRNGNLDPALPLIVVERDPVLAAKIETDLRRLGFERLSVHVGELCELPITEPVDFVFIDLLGTLDYRLCAWMRDELAPCLVEGSRLGLSVAYSRRNNQFVEAAERAYNDSFPDEVGEMRERLRLFGAHRLIPLMLIRGTFNEHLFAFTGLMPYRDSNYPMMTFRFSGFERLLGETNGSPPLTDVVNSFTPKERKKTMIDRSEAAHKAWGTRREKARAAERSDRAKRAWDTRRAKANETVDVRSLAALKAWETRRANGWVHPARR